MSAFPTPNGLPAAVPSKPPFAFRNGESFNGGIARFAVSNWHERMIEVTSAAGMEFGHRPSASAVDLDRLAALADFMSVDVAELSARARPHHGENTGGGGRRVFNGLILPSALVESRIRRHAPVALRLPDSDHHRALWDLRLLPACTETGQILLDRCQSTICEGGRVRWVVTSGVAHCEHCMADLRESGSPTIEPDLLAAMQPVAHLFSAAQRHEALSRLPAGLSAGDGQLAADLLVALMPVVDPTLRNDMQRLHLVDPVRVCEATAKAWDLMEGWPDRFLDLIKLRMEGRGKRHDDGNFGRTAHFLRKLDASGSPALEAVIAEVRDTFDLNGPVGAAIAARTYRIKKASSVISVGTQRLAELRRCKALSTIVALRAGRCELLFDRAEIDRLTKEVSSRMGFDRASSLLGIPHEGVVQLVELRMLELLDHPFHLARYGVHQTTQASFTRLTAELIANQSPLTDGKPIRITRAMKAIGGRFKPWGPAVGALLTGQLPYTVDNGEVPLIDRIYILPKDARRIAELVFSPGATSRLVSATLMSKDDAADVLNIGTQQVTDLFADVPTKKGCREKTLAVTDVLAMASRSISSSELAARRGVTTHRAYADAVRASIENHGLAGFCRAGAEAEFGL